MIFKNAYDPVELVAYTTLVRYCGDSCCRGT
jgi:hypothetical protein